MSEKYDHIGIDYNLTRKADDYLVKRLFYHLNPVSGERYLDIGCGTGNYTIALHRKGVQFIGIDPSRQMLNKAKAKNTAIDWRIGKAEDIPLSDDSVGGSIATLTLHHWVNLHEGFQELSRVLKPNAKAVCFTSTPKQMKGYWLNHYFPKMMEHSIAQMPSGNIIEQNLKANGFNILTFEKYAVKADLQDLFLYSGKHHPKRYLNEQIRKGISSFSALADDTEIREGLLKLEKDMETGGIHQIMEHYRNTDGDYLFIIGQKSA